MRRFPPTKRAYAIASKDRRGRWTIYGNSVGRDSRELERWAATLRVTNPRHDFCVIEWRVVG